MEKSLHVAEGDIPAVFKTRRQIATELGLTQSGATKRIREWVVSGRVTVACWRITSGQVTRPTPHYCITSELPKNFKR